MNVDELPFGYHVEESAVVVNDGESGVAPEKSTQKVRNNRLIQGENAYSFISGAIFIVFSFCSYMLIVESSSLDSMNFNRCVPNQLFPL